MSTVHKNARIIAAWVRGQAIEYQSPTTGQWYDVPAATDLGTHKHYLEPNPIHPEYDYMRFRIKSTGVETPEQSLQPVAYRLEPVYPPKPTELLTAALMQCMATGETLAGMGGGSEVLSPTFVEGLRKIRRAGGRVELGELP